MTTKNTRKNARNARATYDQRIDHDASQNVNRDADINPDHVIFPSNDDATNANQIVTLKHIIESNKIKCDPKLIRRVLRKYYAHKIDHKLRDAWTFNTNQIPTVLQLIDTHCRAGKSA